MGHTHIEGTIEDAYAFPYIDEGVLNLPPIRLETLLPLSYKKKDKGGYHVPIPVQDWKFLFDFLFQN